MRIDILERLADLIRPALAWKPGASTRPDGAYDGTRFVVTPAMMSILGATADDMEEILKNLGYRQEAVDAATVAAKVLELDAASAPAAAQEVSESNSEMPSVPEAVEAVQSVAEEPQVTADPATEASEPGDEHANVAPEEAPKPIFLWRQARFEGRANRGNQEKRNQPNGGQVRNSPSEQRQARPERNPNQQNERGDRKDHFRGKGKPGGNERFKQEGGKPSGKPQPHAKRPEREERPVKIDMDSPFAKLLALKEQMKK